MRSILNTLSIMLGNIKQCPPRKYEKDEWTARNWIRSTTEPLELLLGLLRTRASSNPEIKMLLQPHQKITKEFAKQIEHVTEIILQSDIPLFPVCNSISRSRRAIARPIYFMHCDFTSAGMTERMRFTSPVFLMEILIEI